MGNINRNQWFAISILFLTVLTGGSAQLTDLIGTYATKLVISFSTLATGFLAGAQIILTGQGQQILDFKALAQGGNAAAQQGIIAATSAVTSSAATPAIAQQAKVALLDAAAALPEVKGNINVTDQALVDDTASSQIKKA